MVVFEAKLFSPFGSYHHPAQPGAVPYHQLAVQYAATKAWAAGLQLRVPIMVAVTADSARPSASLNQAEHDIERLTGKVLPGGVRWLPWHKIAGILTGLLNGSSPTSRPKCTTCFSSWTGEECARCSLGSRWRTTGSSPQRSV